MTRGSERTHVLSGDQSIEATQSSGGAKKAQSVGEEDSLAIKQISEEGTDARTRSDQRKPAEHYKKRFDLHPVGVAPLSCGMLVLGLDFVGLASERSGRFAVQVRKIKSRWRRVSRDVRCIGGESRRRPVRRGGRWIRRERQWRRAGHEGRIGRDCRRFVRDENRWFDVAHRRRLFFGVTCRPARGWIGAGQLVLMAAFWAPHASAFEFGGVPGFTTTAWAVSGAHGWPPGSHGLRRSPFQPAQREGRLLNPGILGCDIRVDDEVCR